MTRNLIVYFLILTSTLSMSACSTSRKTMMLPECYQSARIEKNNELLSISFPCIKGKPELQSYSQDFLNKDYSEFRSAGWDQHYNNHWLNIKYLMIVHYDQIGNILEVKLKRNRPSRSFKEIKGDGRSLFKIFKELKIIIDQK